MPALVLIALATAITVGLALGGRFSGLAATPIAASPFAAAALGVLVAASIFAGGRALDLALIAAANVMLGLFFVSNMRRHRGAIRLGIALLALGWALNAIVIAANAGMPLSMAAYRASGQTAIVTPGEGGFFKAVIADDETILPWLGDTIPLKAIRRVVSAGDLALVLGLGIVVVGAMRAGVPAFTNLVADETTPHEPRGRVPVAPPPFG